MIEPDDAIRRFPSIETKLHFNDRCMTAGSHMVEWLRLMNLILITTDGLEHYPEETARVLTRLSTAWALKCGVLDRAVLLGNSQFCRRIAMEEGLKEARHSTGDLREDILSLGISPDRGVVIATARQPFRESWLLDAVERGMKEHPSRIVAARTDRKDDHLQKELTDASLIGLSPFILKELRAGAEWDDIRHVRVLHNAETWFDGHYPTEELPNEQSMLVKNVERASFLPPAQLPEQVVIVGSSNSIIGSRAGRVIDALEAVIRVNWVKIKGFEEDVGSRMDYHATKYFQTLKEAQPIFPDAKSVAMRWFQSKDRKHWDRFDYGITPAIEKRAEELTGNMVFISTGLFAIVWALDRGARRIMLAGYGGREHSAKISYYSNQTDRFALSGWKSREDKVLDQLVSDGVLEYLD